MANEHAGGNPPYCPWSTFVTFVKGLQGEVVPPVIDHTLIRNLSGSAQSQLRGALRFLSLVQGENDTVTPELRALVASSADPDEWKEGLATLIPPPYEPIVRDVDLAAGTRGQLEDAFREKGGVSGSVLQKAVRFYLSAMIEAGSTMSPHFGAPGTNGKSGPTRKSGPRRTKRPKSQPNTGDAAESEQQQAPPGTEVINVSVPNGRTIRVVMPEGLSKGEEDFVIVTLQGYFTLKRAGQE